MKNIISKTDIKDMINESCVNKYCAEDISLIENYYEAINDTTQTWHCHHRLETELNILADELIRRNMYFNRPASELIFLTIEEHHKLHMNGCKNPFYGKLHSETTKEKMSKAHIGKKRKPFSEDTKEKMSVSARKPKFKYKWLTPSGEIKIMSKRNARYYHPDWKLIEEEN